jgi:hypothetical protein
VRQITPRSLLESNGSATAKPAREESGYRAPVAAPLGRTATRLRFAAGWSVDDLAKASDAALTPSSSSPEARVEQDRV